MAKEKDTIQHSQFGQDYIRDGKLVKIIRENVQAAKPWFPNKPEIYAGKKKRPKTTEERMLDEHRRRFPEIINISKITFSDFYTDADLTRRLPKWNPSLNPEPLFYKDKDGRLGMTLILLDDSTGTDRDEMTIWRHSLGEFMEILYALTIINGKILDKRYHEYKFATADGIQNLFTRYVDILRTCGEDSYLNTVKQRLAFTAGMIKAVCQESVWKCFDMLIYIDDICEQCMTGVVEELIGVPGKRRTNDPEIPNDNDDNTTPEK